MVPSLILLSLLSAAPADAFASRHPGASAVATAGANGLAHASGFLFDPGAPGPEAAARAFLDVHGAAFGVTPGQALVLRGAPSLGHAGAVRFERRAQGLPVLGGDLVLGVDARNRVFLVNGGGVPSTVSGRHALGEAAARAAALSSFGRAVRGAGPASIVSGWRAAGAVLRPAYRVDFVAREPAGDWRVFVDGETGELLFREDLRLHVSVPGNVFEVSPVETTASLCPLSGAAHTFCASLAFASLPNLVTGSDLAGTQATVFHCNGADAPASAGGIPGSCVPVVTQTGSFHFAADSTYRSAADAFAAAMAYYHLDRHVTFLEGLDPTLPGGPSRALNGSLPAFVNAGDGGAPLDNAYYSPLLDGMVFGQGATADYAYDATVVYHELDHAVVSAWGGFDPDLDALGGLDEPAAVNEGTADALAVAETGRSEVGAFLGATSTPPSAALRDMADPGASRTCRGDGTVVSQFGAASVNGLDGEVHDDGEIWNGFFWEVYQGLEAAGVRSCGGACAAAPAIQYQAVQLAGGTSPTLNTYWQTMKAAAGALLPVASGASAYVDCVARRRKLDRCDRTFPLYAGERKVQFVRLRFSPFQPVLHASGPTQFSVCSALGTSTTVWVRNGAPVQINPGTGNVVAADGSGSFTRACQSGAVTFSLPTAGDWYLLFDSPNALVGGSPGLDIYRIDAGSTGMATRPVSMPPPTCVPPFLAIAPAAVTVPPRGGATFTATGGAGTGYAWSLATNASGGSITPAGAYTAGLAGSVTDVVQVTDALGNADTRAVTVSAGITISPATASTTPGGSIPFAASGGSGTGFAWALAMNASGGSVTPAGVYTAGATTGVTDVVEVTDSLGNTAARGVMVVAPLAITPATATTPPRGSLTFGASGGSGTGYTWALATNASGGSVTAAGVYTAGATGGVTDVVRVADSLGNVAEASVTVTASPGGSAGGGGCGCGATGDASPLLALGAAALLRRRRKGAGPPAPGEDG